MARSDAAFGAYFRSMRARLGPPQAIVATAHEIARVVYHLLKYHEACKEESAAVYTRQRHERELKHLTRRASKLGYALTPAAASQPASVISPWGKRRFLSKPVLGAPLARGTEGACEGDSHSSAYVPMFRLRVLQARPVRMR